MTRLIIAEKHSVAQAIAQALDTSAIRKDGYLQCADTRHLGARPPRQPRYPGPVPGPRLGALADGYAAP